MKVFQRVSLDYLMNISGWVFRQHILSQFAVVFLIQRLTALKRVNLS